MADLHSDWDVERLRKQRMYAVVAAVALLCVVVGLIAWGSGNQTALNEQQAQLKQDLNARIDDLEKKRVEAVALHSAKEGEIKVEVERRQAVETVVKAKDTRIDALNTEIADMKVKRAEVEGAMEALKKNFTDLGLAHEKNIEQLAKAREELTKLDEKYWKLAYERDDLLQKNKELTSAMAQAQRENDAWKNTVADMRGQLGQMEGKVAGYEKAIAGYENAVKNYEARVEEYKGDKQAMGQQIEKLETELVEERKEWRHTKAHGIVGLPADLLGGARTLLFGKPKPKKAKVAPADTAAPAGETPVDATTVTPTGAPAPTATPLEMVAPAKAG